MSMTIFALLLSRTASMSASWASAGSGWNWLEPAKYSTMLRLSTLWSRSRTAKARLPTSKETPQVTAVMRMTGPKRAKKVRTWSRRSSLPSRMAKVRMVASQPRRDWKEAALLCLLPPPPPSPTGGGGSSAGDGAAVGGSLAVVADDVSTSAEEIRALPPPQPSPAALRCEGGGRTVGDWAAVGVSSAMMAGGSLAVADSVAV